MSCLHESVLEPLRKMAYNLGVKRSKEIFKLAGKVLLLESIDLSKKLINRAETQKLRIKQAQEMVQTLQELKGASLKFGQLLSIDVSGYLPDEAKAVLAKLQKDVPPEDLNSLLAHYPELKEIQIDQKALAAASIGQVHLCTWKNQKAIIKIQYPDVENSIDADLKILRFILSKALYFFPPKVDLDTIINELKDSLKQECDYELEAKKLELYKSLMNPEMFYVPAVYEARKRFLVQEYLQGPTLTEWLKKSPTKDQKYKMANQLIELYLQEFFIHGVVQTDPNPANFIVMNDLKLGLLDGGAIKIYEKKFIHDYLSMIKSAHEENDQGILQTGRRMGFLQPKESKKAEDEFIELVKYLITPFKDPNSYPLRDQTYNDKVLELSMEFSKTIKQAKFPKEIILLHRKLGGLFSLLQKLDPDLNFCSWWPRVSSIEVQLK